MVTRHLGQLPKELVAHIARFADAPSILALSRTSRTIRAAAYDALVFRDLIITALHATGTIETADILALADRASNDTSTWARYAYAVHQADLIAQMSEDEAQMRGLDMRWLPQLLLVVKHPCVRQIRWEHQAQRGPLINSVGLAFCVAFSSLFETARLSDQAKGGVFAAKHSRHLTSKSLINLSMTALHLRKMLETRMAVWPFNSAASTPYISLPHIENIPLQPLDTTYRLPPPFTLASGSDGDADGSEWQSWLCSHGMALGQSDGPWCGYYTTFNAGMIDPPMKNINFSKQNAEGAGEVPMVAQGGSDGHGTFDIRGHILIQDGWPHFLGHKVYTSGASVAGLEWDWSLIATPFGLFGTWGYRTTPRHNNRQGHVWLWKEDWANSPRG